MTFSEALALTVSTLSATGIGGAGITYEVLVGDENLAVRGEPPRIVVVPMGAQPMNVVRQQGAGPRTLGGERHSFSAVLWHVATDARSEDIGADYNAVMDMKGAFVAAMRGAFGSAFQLGPSEWSAREGESIDERGRELSQSFTLDLNFPDAPEGTAIVTQTTTNIGASNPGVSFNNP